MRADEIKRALAKRHRNDVFLTEVKSGRTWHNAELLIVDAIGIKRSWAHPCITVYEVKVNRQDFLRDDKWPGYRAYCHQLYFACPKDLIKPEELPEDIGLLWYMADSNGFATKRKAHHRPIDIPRDLFYHLIISHTESDRHPFFSTRRELLAEWAADKANRVTLGYAVRSKMLELIQEKDREIVRLQRRVENLEHSDRQYWALLGTLKLAGIDARSAWDLECQLKRRLTETMPAEVLSLVSDLKHQVERLDAMVQQRKEAQP